MKPQVRNTHADRPVPRASLPIRAERSTAGEVVLTFYALTAEGDRLPCHRVVGDPDAASTKLYEPLGVAIVQLMGMFWDL